MISQPNRKRSDHDQIKSEKHYINLTECTLEVFKKLKISRQLGVGSGVKNLGEHAKHVASIWLTFFHLFFFGRDGVLGIFCGGYDYSRHEPNGKSNFCTPLMHICSIIMMEWRYSWASNITMEEERETIKKHTQTIERECCLDGKRLRGICYLCSSVSIIWSITTLSVDFRLCVCSLANIHWL